MITASKEGVFLIGCVLDEEINLSELALWIRRAAVLEGLNDDLLSHEIMILY